MNVLLTFLILLAPFAIAALLSWVARRTSPLRAYLANVADDPDWFRIQHDADAVRTRFEEVPTWPSSGGRDERR